MGVVTGSCLDHLVDWEQAEQLGQCRTALECEEPSVGGDSLEKSSELLMD